MKKRRRRRWDRFMPTMTLIQRDAHNHWLLESGEVIQPFALYLVTLDSVLPGISTVSIFMTQ